MRHGRRDPLQPSWSLSAKIEGPGFSPAHRFLGAWEAFPRAAPLHGAGIQPANHRWVDRLPAPVKPAQRTAWA